MKPVVAVDLGGTLCDGPQGQSVPMAGSESALAQIESAFEIFIVSQCGLATAEASKKWLADFKFNIPLDHQIYIPFKECNKNRVLQEINAEYFIDDRLKHIAPATEILDYGNVIHFKGKIGTTFCLCIDTWDEVCEWLFTMLRIDEISPVGQDRNKWSYSWQPF